MENETKLIAERERAALAEQVIQNPVYVEAKDMITGNLVDAWRSTHVSQDHEREKIFLMLQMAEQFFDVLDTTIRTGKFAELQLGDPNG